MMREDRDWASYATWVCNRDPGHSELVYKEGNPTRACRAAGCDGTMHFHDKRQDEPGEWPWYATWVCARDPAHSEVIPDAEYRQIARPSRNARFR